MTILWTHSMSNIVLANTFHREQITYPKTHHFLVKYHMLFKPENVN